MLKLTISHAFSQSVKLTLFEVVFLRRIVEMPFLL